MLNTQIDGAPVPATCSAKWWLQTDSSLNDHHFTSDTRPEGPCLGPFESHDDLLEVYVPGVDLSDADCPVEGLK